MPRDADFPQRCRDLVQERLVELGYTVERDSKRSSGRLRVSGAVGGFEVYVACVNGRAGYPMWLERRLALSNDRVVMVVLLPQDGADPELYLVPTLDWRSPQSPLVNPQYPGLKSEPEYGIRLSSESYNDFQRYRWRGEPAAFPALP